MIELPFFDYLLYSLKSGYSLNSNMKTFLKERQSSGHKNKENCQSQLHYNFEKKLRGVEKAGKQKEKDAFVQRVNGYIETISIQNKHQKGSFRVPRQLFDQNPKKPEKAPSRKSSWDHIASLNKKIKNEKQINKNLQKCIIQIQKMLWERNDRLEALEQQLTYQKLIGRENYQQYEQASEESSIKMRATEGDLKKYANSLGLKKILHSLNNQQIQEASEYSDTKNSPSEASSIDCHKSYIKIERPRTESQSQLPSRRRR